MQAQAAFQKIRVRVKIRLRIDRPAEPFSQISRSLHFRQEAAERAKIILAGNPGIELLVAEP